MEDFPECEQFPVHLRSICRGEVLTSELCNGYREGWGLTPLPGSAFANHAPHSVPTPRLPERDVRSPSTPVPSFVQRVLSFTSALTDHARDGFVKCDEATIETRLASCKSCSSFTGTHCIECGCVCNSDSVFFNKLAWRSEKCPLGQW